MAAFLGMCCCRGWLGTSLLPFWDKTSHPPFLSFFPRSLSLSPPSPHACHPPLILRDKDRQRPTIECPTLPAACPGSDKDTDAPPREMVRGRQRDEVKKATSGRDQGEKREREGQYERGMKKREQ